jgi:hypothetical protein
MKNLSLSIPRPCSEKWENFTPSAGGGFCSSCSKVVVDFTNMSDDEIIDFFGKKPAHACGRFRTGQLKAYSAHAPLKVNPGLTLLKAGFLSMLFIMSGKQASAQDTPKPKKEVVDKPKHAVDKNAVEDVKQTLKGIVLTEENEPLAGANIILKGSTAGTVADADGRFEFPQKVKEGDVIAVYFIGFEPKEYTVQKKNSDELTIQMVCDYSIMGELVVVGGVYAEKPSMFRRLWWKVKGLF